MLVAEILGLWGDKQKLKQSKGFTLRLLGLFGAFWANVWALGAKVWDPTLRVQEPEAVV